MRQLVSSVDAGDQNTPNTARKKTNGHSDSCSSMCDPTKPDSDTPPSWWVHLSSTIHISWAHDRS